MKRLAQQGTTYIAGKITEEPKVEESHSFFKSFVEIKITVLRVK